MEQYYQAMIRDILAEKLYDAMGKITRLEENELLLNDCLKTAKVNLAIAENDLKEMAVEVAKVCQCENGCADHDLVCTVCD